MVEVPPWNGNMLKGDRAAKTVKASYPNKRLCPKSGQYPLAMTQNRLKRGKMGLAMGGKYYTGICQLKDG